jgi:hypothetical protein
LLLGKGAQRRRVADVGQVRGGELAVRHVHLDELEEVAGLALQRLVRGASQGLLE